MKETLGYFSGSSKIDWSCPNCHTVNLTRVNQGKQAGSHICKCRNCKETRRVLAYGYDPAPVPCDKYANYSMTCKDTNCEVKK